jgi:hypothetical protein
VLPIKISYKVLDNEARILVEALSVLGERMFGQQPHGPAGNKEVTRREFLANGVQFLGLIPLLGFFGSFLFRPTHSSLQRLGRSLDSPDDVLTVYKMVPLLGIKYNKAEIGHMANKIFPSIEAAHAHRPHRGFLYGLKAVPLPNSIVGGMDKDTLFYNRKDFDQRVLSDKHYWQRLGVNVSVIFGVVKNA